MEIDRVVGGVRHPWATTDIILEAMKTFEVRQDDIWLITYPKAGTTWMQEIISVLYYGCDLQKADEKDVTSRFYFLDLKRPHVMHDPHVLAANDPVSPRILKTHLQSHQMAPEIIKKKPKIVYVARNPKDNLVSLYYFHKANSLIRTYHSWDECFQAFCTGQVLGGSWFDMNLYWWNKRNDDNVLFVKYEDMKKDLNAIIVQVSEFLGWPIPDGKLEDIAKHCSFSSMQQNPKTNFSNSKIIDVSVSPFMRKGVVGDWKNHFTASQSEEFDKLYEEKMKDSGLTFQYEL